MLHVPLCRWMPLPSDDAIIVISERKDKNDLAGVGFHIARYPPSQLKINFLSVLAKANDDLQHVACSKSFRNLTDARIHPLCLSTDLIILRQIYGGPDAPLTPPVDIKMQVAHIVGQTWSARKRLIFQRYRLFHLRLVEIEVGDVQIPLLQTKH